VNLLCNTSTAGARRNQTAERQHGRPICPFRGHDHEQAKLMTVLQEIPPPFSCNERSNNQFLSFLLELTAVGFSIRAALNSRSSIPFQLPTPRELGIVRLTSKDYNNFPNKVATGSQHADSKTRGCKLQNCSCLVVLGLFTTHSY
jgi:hypothetical protein